MADKIKAFAKRPGQPPRSVWVTNSLKNLQTYVGGYIEAVTLTSDCAVICNEEGRILGLPHNCNVAGIDFVGDILFVGIKGEEFADMPIDFAAFKKMFKSLWEV